MIPSVAIEGVISEGVYYSKVDPDVGVRVLRRGLAVAQMKWPIGQVLATILRCEERFAEALEAYDLVIRSAPEDCCTTTT